MAEVNISNVEQMLSRTVKNDGRCGGLQFAVGQEVTVLTYMTTEENEDN